MDENERKRKRELGLEFDNEDEDDVISEHREMPREGLRKNKKPKTAKGEDEAGDAEGAAQRKVKADKRKEKRERKKEKVEKKKEKVEAKKARKQDGDLAETANGDNSDAEEDQEVDDAAAEPDELDQMDMSGLADEEDAPESSVPTTPEVASPAFDISANQSTASSSSSIAPPATETSTQKQTSSTATKGPESKEPAQAKKGKAFTLPKIDSEELQSRLKARIEELRARRKATGPEGQPVRSRQEMLEARRQKSEARKLHKKELRRKAKEEEDRLNNDRLRGSGSPLVTDPFSPSHDNNNFSFGRVVFEDGAQADPSLKGYFDVHKKGPQDARTALQVAQKKAERLATMDDSKRADIQEKDLWLNAKKRAHGEKVRDDQNLLKKALKRKEHGKLKSEKEWNERKDGVKKGIESRERKRDENLKKRAEGKGQKGKSKGAQGKGKKKGRPGFEGRFKS